MAAPVIVRGVQLIPDHIYNINYGPARFQANGVSYGGVVNGDHVFYRAAGEPIWLDGLDRINDIQYVGAPEPRVQRQLFPEGGRRKQRRRNLRKTRRRRSRHTRRRSESR